MSQFKLTLWVNVPDPAADAAGDTLMDALCSMADGLKESLGAESEGATVTTVPEPPAVAVGQNLWVAVYEHKYGMDTFACTTRLAAEIIREGVAAQFWEAEMGTLPKPSDPEELADAYFDEMGSHGEFFTIQETTLQGS